MECEVCRPLLARSLNGDGDRDATQRSDVDRHLATCTNCKREYDNLLAVQSGLKNKALLYKAPDDLKARLLAAHQPAVSEVNNSANNAAKTTRQSGRRWGWGSGLVAAFVCLGFSGWSYVYFAAQSEQVLLTQEIVSAHVRSLMASHLADVVSTDMHTVKPWFAGKLDFSPLVADFPEKDFTLTGGRLDYIHGRAVAALIYKHRQHVINVFTWPADASRAGAIAAKNGYNVVNWRQDGANAMEFWMVSDLNAGELGELKTLIQQKDAR